MTTPTSDECRQMIQVDPASKRSAASAGLYRVTE